MGVLKGVGVMGTTGQHNTKIMALKKLLLQASSVPKRINFFQIKPFGIGNNNASCIDDININAKWKISL